MLKKEELIHEINRLKKERNAIIVAHNYQNDEVQDIADAMGDSFYLSKVCAKSDASVIVFCGVHFMAESAKILSPGKTVLLPESQAGCPMADSITPEDVRRLKRLYPKAAVVCYINTSADVKAESDICCTSSNAIDVVKSVDEEEVLFIPDRNLGAFVAKHVPEKQVVLYDGCCATHCRFGSKEVLEAKQLYPDAAVAVHPECEPEVTSIADYVGSTSGIIDYCRSSGKRRFIIGTEMGVIHKLKSDNPDKEFYIASTRLVCSNMKMTTLNSVYKSLKKNKTVIEVEESVRRRAAGCLERMLKI